MIYLLDSGVASTSNYCKHYLGLSGNLEDLVGHGTSMASVIKSISPHTELVSIKLGDENPTLHDVEESLKFIHQDGIILFNANFEFQDKLLHLEDSLKTLSTKHKIIVPAGNNSRSIDYYSPARCDFVWTVGSLNKSKQPTKVSNFKGQKEIDLWVVSTNIKAYNSNREEIRIFGTSVAAAIVAALVDKHSCQNKDQLQFYIDQYNDTVAIN